MKLFPNLWWDHKYVLWRHEHSSEYYHARNFDIMRGKQVGIRVLMQPDIDWLGGELHPMVLLRTLRLIRDTPHMQWFLPLTTPMLWSSAFTREAIRLGISGYFKSDELLFNVQSGEKMLPNLWVGVVFGKQFAGKYELDVRKKIVGLLNIPVERRFLWFDPLLKPVDITAPGGIPYGIDWVIAGVEPRRPGIRDLNDQCQFSGVPFFYHGKIKYKHIGDGHNRFPSIARDPNPIERPRPLTLITK